MRRRSRSFAEAAGGAPAGLSLGRQLRQITYRLIVARPRRSCRMRRGQKPSMPLRVFALSRKTRGWMRHPRRSLSSCLRADTDDGSPTGRPRVVRPILCRRAAPELGAARSSGRPTLTKKIGGPEDRARPVTAFEVLPALPRLVRSTTRRRPRRKLRYRYNTACVGTVNCCFERA